MSLFIPFRYRFKQIPHSRRSKTDSLLNSLNRNFTLSLPAKIDSMNILLLVGGLLLILLGANGLTDGAASVAQRFRIPNIVIGLTIVAFGTSAPELTVSVSSALKGSADIAIGNVVGSNIFNTLMIVGCTALFAPIAVTRNTLQKEIPLCILSSIALLVCANDVFLNGDEANILSITDGLLLLCFFAIFLSYTFAIASRTPEETAGNDGNIKQLPLWKSTLYILGGLGALIAGSSLEEEPGNSHWQRSGQQPVQRILRIRLQRIHHTFTPDGHYQLGLMGTGRVGHSALALRTVLCQTHHYPYRGKHYGTLLHCIYGIPHL